MPTPAEISAQVDLEREQIRQGLLHLHNNTRNLENKDYASASVYGVSSIQQLLPLVVARINDTKSRIRKGQAGKNFGEIRTYLSDFDAESAAAITCKVTFDKVFSTKDRSNYVVNVTDSIGQAIENECMMRHYEKECPGLLNFIKEKYWHKSSGTQQKVTNVRTMMNRHDVNHWKTWGRVIRVRLGAWLLSCLCEASNWFHIYMKQVGRKRHNLVVPTPEFHAIKDQVMATAEMFSPIAWPMLVPPNDWDLLGEKPGGYLLNELMKGYPMVRRGNPGCIQGKNVVDYLNHVQRVAFTLNPFIVGVAETLMDRGISVGKFIPVVEIPLPPKPPDIETNAEARKDYRRRAAEVCNINAQAFQKSCRTRMTMNAVSVFKEKGKFYHPWSCDYRGRIYPICTVLSPQDTDFGKSLLKFHSESFMTPEAEQWLAFQVSTCYGLSKEPMQKRIEWALENHDLISRIAKEPIETLPEWEAADDPWSFLAACDEYYHCIIKCDRNHTSSFIACDATCSGLQILAGLSRDRSTAAKVNCIPSDKPQDAYAVIAETSLPKIPEHLKSVWDRKCTKRVCMTVPYNAKPYSNRGYIREALKKKGIEVDKDDLTQCVKAVRDAMDKVFPGPMRVMKWIEDEVSRAIDRGLTELSWTTPSGFVVNQKLMKPQIKIIELNLLGRCEVHIADKTTDEVDKSHHKNATSPNLIHSLDASLLCLSAIRFNAPISLIHDSVLCRATDMSTLSRIVRETYVYLFAEHDYLKTFAQHIGAETEPPIIGDLEPESVINSTYFFC